MRRGREEKKPLSFPDLSSKLPIYAQNITNTAELFEPGINLENLPPLWVPRDLAYLYCRRNHVTESSPRIISSEWIMKSPSFLMVSKLQSQLRGSCGRVYKLGSRWWRKHTQAETRSLHGAGKAKEGRPLSLKAAPENGEKIFHPSDSIIRVTHTK